MPVLFEFHNTVGTLNLQPVSAKMDCALSIPSSCWAGHWDALSSASQELSESGGSSVLAAVRGFVDHAQLFSHCSALVHHGGAGTVAAALRAGLSSVICPLQFDQFMWVRDIASRSTQKTPMP